MLSCNLPGAKPAQTLRHSLLALMFCNAAVAAEIPPQAVTLTGTAVHELQFQGRSYPLWVDIPPSCQQRKSACPLLLVTDAPYAFPLIRSIRNRVGQQGRNIEDFVLAGLAYPVTETPVASRSRDYTPTNVKARPPLLGEDYGAAVYGNAPAFAGFVAKQVLPLLQQQYRIDPTRQIYLGHSYGGLFGAYLVLHGRKKHQFITAFGRNVNPEWVESELVQQLPIAQAWLYGEALPANVAVLVPRFSSVSDAELAAAVEQVNQTLPDYARVHHWLRGEQAFTDDNGLATSNGRLRRVALLEHYQSAITQVMAGETVY